MLRPTNPATASAASAPIAPNDVAVRRISLLASASDTCSVRLSPAGHCVAYRARVPELLGPTRLRHMRLVTGNPECATTLARIGLTAGASVWTARSVVDLVVNEHDPGDPTADEELFLVVR